MVLGAKFGRGSQFGLSTGESAGRSGVSRSVDGFESHCGESSAAAAAAIEPCGKSLRMGDDRLLQHSCIP